MRTPSLFFCYFWLCKLCTTNVQEVRVRMSQTLEVIAALNVAIFIAMNYNNIYLLQMGWRRVAVVIYMYKNMNWGTNLINPLTSQSLRLTLCTTSFNIKKYCVLPTLHLCVLRGSQNKQRLFLYTALTYRFLKPKQCVFTARYELGL